MKTSKAISNKDAYQNELASAIQPEQTANEDSKTIETITIDLQPLIKLCEQGEPRPKTTTIGTLPTDHDPERYVHDAKRIIYAPNPGVKLETDDHFWFITWFEQHASASEREQFKQVYPFALSGIGLLKSEQQQRVKRLYLQLPKYMYREPTVNYYPYTLPLSVFQLLKNITKVERRSRKWRQVVVRRAKLLSLFFHSWHLATTTAKSISGLFSMSYIMEHTDQKGDMHLCKDIIMFEKYNFLTCIGHGGRTSQGKEIPNRYKYNILLFEDDLLFPLTLVSPGINSTNYSHRCDDLIHKFYGETTEQVFITDTWHRREASARQYRKARKEKKAATEKAWIVPTNTAKADLELKTERSIQAIQELNVTGINREYLVQLIEHLTHLKASTADEDERKWLDVENRIANEMLNHGLVYRFEYTRSGRTKVTRKANIDRSGVYANHLNTSRTPGKQGYLAVWCAISSSLASLVDIRSAEPLVAAICSGDENLFKDYITGDVYDFATQRLQLPEAYQNRKTLKNKLWLPIQYGCTLNSALSLQSFKGMSFFQSQNYINDTIEAYKLLKDYLKTAYPKYWEKLEHFRNLGRKLAKSDFYPELPNGVPLKFDRGKPHSVPPIVMQAHVSKIINMLFNKLWEDGFEPVFDIHDAVVTRKPVEKEYANKIVREAVLELIVSYGLDWEVPEDTMFVTVDPIKYEPNLPELKSYSVDLEPDIEYWDTDFVFDEAFV